MNTMSFAQLKKNSQNSIEKLESELNKFKNDRPSDARFWYPDVDKAGNGYAVIRFLPSHFEDSPPIVRVYSHSFEGPTGKWYIENSLTTIGQADPCSEYNSKLWNTGLEANKQLARNQKRKENFICNIQVITDSAHPENDGGVFLFKFGKKIFEKIEGAMKPQFPDDPKIDAFNLFEGANFKIKIRTKDKYRNYDDSVFSDVSPLAKTDKEIEEIWKKTYSLNEFLDLKNFKSYDQLKASLERVLGKSIDKPITSDVEKSSKPADVQSAPVGKTKKAKSQPVVESEQEETDDESIDFFRNLVDED